MLEREEIIEQAYFFRTLRERLEMNLPLQELLEHIRDEILSSTKLPMAIDFLHAELMQEGVIGPAMQRLNHYFTAFQTYVFTEAEQETGRFDLRIGLEILQREAEYKSKEPTPGGVFLYHFETLCRNRLRYDPGLDASSSDPIFDETWREWVQLVRRQVGIVDLADMIYVRSEHYLTQQQRQGFEPADEGRAVLFGEKEGKIALANRKKEPLLLLAALQRHLSYPAVPRPKPPAEDPDLIPQLSRRIERLETRLKLMEDEQRDGSIDITKFYGSDGA